MQGTFSLIGEMGMTGTLIMVNQYQWRDLEALRVSNSRSMPPFCGVAIP